MIFEFIWKGGLVIGFTIISCLVMKEVWLWAGGSEEELEEKFGGDRSGKRNF